ncbi:hypothetical protein C8R47DRAFT_1230309 [Mycena vitilis]|nr:hypothetical protein C8R47DRAFT_1230309 [Mycena vitilis]
MDTGSNPHTLPRRGKAVLLNFELVKIIEQHFENSDRRLVVEAPFRAATYVTREPSPAPPEVDNNDNSVGDGSDMEFDSTGPPDTSSEPEANFSAGEEDSDFDDDASMPAADNGSQDEEDGDGDSSSDFAPSASDGAPSPSPFGYDPSPMPSAEWCEGFISHFSPYPLHRREPTALAELVPVPDVLHVAHLGLMGFDPIVWDEPRAFVDLHDRIAAFFVGPPHERTRWENTIMAATDVMSHAYRHLDMHGIEDHTLRAGFRYGAKGVERPQNLVNNDANMVILTELRHSPVIQEIISFQNATMKMLASSLWESAHDAITAVMDNDTTLRLPFHQCLGEPTQSTAFAQVEYTFAIDNSYPQLHPRDHPTGWTVFTSVGNYDANESALILWDQRRMVRFPPGSTFLLPAGLFRYSFTGVSDESSRMLISQSFDGEICRFLQDDMFYEPKAPSFVTDEAWEADRQRRAEEAVSKYPTLNEYDLNSGYA